MSTEVWCDECGRGHPFNGAKRQTTARRRFVIAVMRPLRAPLRPFLAVWDAIGRLEERLIEWADKPERAAYDARNR